MRMHTAVWVLLSALAGVAPARGQRTVEIPEGPASFELVDSSRRLTVWTYRPPALRPSARVVFVMHGTNRDGKRYRDQWQAHAETEGFLLVVPQLDQAAFPPSAYQRGNVVDASGAPRRPEEWTFGIIERLFDVVTRSLRLRTSTYAIYGHSAGAQFVHRFVLFVPESRCSVAIAANAGWYTMPTFADTYPYGLGRSPANETTLRNALAKTFVILVGDDDTDDSDPSLRNTRRAQEQGSNRFERARTFYETAHRASRATGASLQWQFAVVRDAGHSNRAMADAAVRYLR